MGHAGLIDQKYDIVVIGAGGHASVIVDVLQSQTDFKICLTDADKTKIGSDILGCPIIGTDDVLRDIHVDYFVIGLGSVRATENETRALLFDRAVDAGLKPYTLISSQAYVSKTVQVKDGAVIFPRALINANAKIGRNVIINSCAVIEHDCLIGDHVHICPAATLSGQVVVKDKSLIGINSTIRQSVTIGQGATIGAASLILNDVDDFLTKVGSPAHLL